MAGFRRGAYRKSGGRVMRRGGQLTKKFRSKIIRTVQRMSPRQYKAPFDPPNIRNDYPVRRWVRISVAPTGTSVVSTAIYNKDSNDYTSTTTPRYQSCKLLKLRAYGPVQGAALTLLIPGGGLLEDSASYTDFGDGTRRPCVAVELPATVSKFPNTGTAVTFATFVAGSVEIMDVYVEFS